MSIQGRFTVAVPARFKVELTAQKVAWIAKIFESLNRLGRRFNDSDDDSHSRFNDDPLYYTLSIKLFTCISNWWIVYWIVFKRLTVKYVTRFIDDSPCEINPESPMNRLSNRALNRHNWPPLTCSRQRSDALVYQARYPPRFLQSFLGTPYGSRSA